MWVVHESLRPGIEVKLISSAAHGRCRSLPPPPPHPLPQATCLVWSLIPIVFQVIIVQNVKTKTKIKICWTVSRDVLVARLKRLVVAMTLFVNIVCFAILYRISFPGIYVIMDFIPNHSSDQHKWFVESSKGRQGPYADYYVWHDGITLENGTRTPPNNWVSLHHGDRTQDQKVLGSGPDARYM